MDPFVPAKVQVAINAETKIPHRIDYLICGHKHREQEYVSGYTDQGNAVVIRVPSLCGMDEYAQRLGYGGRPGALAMVLEAGYGRRCIYPISL